MSNHESERMLWITLILPSIAIALHYYSSDITASWLILMFTTVWALDSFSDKQKYNQNQEKLHITTSVAYPTVAYTLQAINNNYGITWFIMMIATVFMLTWYSMVIRRLNNGKTERV